MTKNMKLMDAIRLNTNNHHAKLSDVLFGRWLEQQDQGKIGDGLTAFHLSVVIELKSAISEYFEQSDLANSWEKTSEEDKNGMCSILLMDFLIELAHTFHSKFKSDVKDS